MKQIILNESQIGLILESHIIIESIFNFNSVSEFRNEIKKLVKKLIVGGISVASIVSMINNYCYEHNVSDEIKRDVLAIVEEIPPSDESMNSDWILADDKTIATVYNAVPSQCNDDFGNTASMFRLNLDDILSHRIIAMERTFMKKLGLKYGDVVYIEGTNGYDGIWQIQDTMNKRFAGQHKIDILVPNNIKYGKWENLKLYVLKDKTLTDTYKNNMAPQLSKSESKKQVAQKKLELEKNRLNS